MIKFNELQVGDYVIGEYDGNMWEGEVVNLNNDEKQVCLLTEVQEFWFETDKLHPIPLDESQLFKLGFQKVDMEDGSVKYMKGVFRILLPKPGHFSEFEMWYREDKRHINRPIMVHELQNYHYDMVKIHLTKD